MTSQLGIPASADQCYLFQLHGGEPDGPALPYGFIAILASAGALETAYLTMVSTFQLGSIPSKQLDNANCLHAAK